MGSSAPSTPRKRAVLSSHSADRNTGHSSCGGGALSRLVQGSFLPCAGPARGTQGPHFVGESRQAPWGEAPGCGGLSFLTCCCRCLTQIHAHGWCRHVGRGMGPRDAWLACKNCP